MKSVCDKSKCTGCGACVEICPTCAVSLVDGIDIYEACIEEIKCIDCGACRKVCQNHERVLVRSSKKWLQGWVQDEVAREQASSGGVATELIRSFAETKGTICACSFYDGKFVFSLTSNADDIGRYTGSKYVKSSAIGVYKKIKDLLKNGEKVLFIGLPCQVAAIKKFVGTTNYSELLYTIDLICHGSPSPKILEIFLYERGLKIESIQNIQFRNNNKFGLSIMKKDEGKWIPLSLGKTIDFYTYMFLNGLGYTKNCYNCIYACRERTGDISLGDAW